MNQTEAQQKYAEFQTKIKATEKPGLIGMAAGLERLQLQNKLNVFRFYCLDLGIKLLEPCPFCGSYDVESVISSNHKELTWVECSGCETEGPPFVSEDRAIAAWNQRVN
jgi:Lar family restriction alleviation protein